MNLCQKLKHSTDFEVGNRGVGAFNISIKTSFKDLFFGAVYYYAGKTDVSKGYWNPKRKLSGNHAYFRDY